MDCERRAPLCHRWAGPTSVHCKQGRELRLTYMAACEALVHVQSQQLSPHSHKEGGGQHPGWGSLGPAPESSQRLELDTLRSGRESGLELQDTSHGQPSPRAHSVVWVPRSLGRALGTRWALGTGSKGRQGIMHVQGPGLHNSLAPLRTWKPPATKCDKQQ